MYYITYKHIEPIEDGKIVPFAMHIYDAVADGQSSQILNNTSGDGYPQGGEPMMGEGNSERAEGD